MLTIDRMSSFERPIVSFAQHFPKETRRLRAFQSHEERPQVFAHEPSDGAVRAEVGTVMLETLLLQIDPDGVVLHSPREEGVCLLVDGDQRGIDSSRGGE